MLYGPHQRAFARRLHTRPIQDPERSRQRNPIILRIHEGDSFYHRSRRRQGQTLRHALQRPQRPGIPPLARQPGDRRQSRREIRLKLPLEMVRAAIAHARRAPNALLRPASQLRVNERDNRRPLTLHMRRLQLCQRPRRGINPSLITHDVTSNLVAFCMLFVSFFQARKQGGALRTARRLRRRRSGPPANLNLFTIRSYLHPYAPPSRPRRCAPRKPPAVAPR